MTVVSPVGCARCKHETMFRCHLKTMALQVCLEHSGLSQWEHKERLCGACRLHFFSAGKDDEQQDEQKPTEGPVVVQTSIPVSSTPFGEVQLQLPVKEEELLPSEETRQMSSKELQGSKPPFGEIQVQIFLRSCTLSRLSRVSRM